MFIHIPPYILLTRAKLRRLGEEARKYDEYRQDEGRGGGGGGEGGGGGVREGGGWCEKEKPRRVSSSADISRSKGCQNNALLEKAESC